MTCELESTYAALARHLPTAIAGDDRLVLTKENLLTPRLNMVTDRLVVRKAMHQKLPGYREEQVNFYAEKLTYGCLGLLVAACVFHDELGTNRIQIALTHPESEVKNLVIQCRHTDPKELPTGYVVLPYALVYVPELIDPAWPIDRDEPRWNLPTFRITNLENKFERESDWLNRDAVEGFGNLAATAHFAELLLRFSNPAHSTRHLILSSGPGGRQVGTMSIEAWFSVPEENT